MVRVEALIVDIDSLNELIQVVFHHSSPPERLLADWAIGMVSEPLVDALSVKNVIAVEHAALRFVFDRLKADCALSREKLARL